MNSLATADIAFIIFYFILVLLAGFYFSRGSDKDSTAYFLAGRKIGWIALGTSIFAANISSEHFIGLAGSGASHGLAVGNFEWMAIFFIMLLGWFFAPIFIRSGVFTTPEFIGKRFDNRSRLFLTTFSIIAYVITKISITLFAGGLLLERVLGLDMYVSAVFMIVLTGIYTIIGGMSTVIYTSVVQAVFLIGGAVTLTVLGLNEIGGIAGLKANLDPSFFDIFKSVKDPDFPWTGIIFGAPILAIWYWCTDQYIVQRILSAKDADTARSGAIFAGFLKILPLFVLVIPGLIAAVLYPGIRGDEAYAIMITGTLLPVGIKGLVLAGVIAAMMSSLASCFTSTATLFTMDYYRQFNPQASESKLVLVGRLATLVMVITAIIWIPVTKVISSQIYVYLQSVQAFISPPIAAVFLAALFWKRANASGAFWSLITGVTIGLIRFLTEIYGFDSSGLIAPLANLLTINYLHFAIFLFVISFSVLAIVSVFTEQAKTGQTLKFTFAKEYIQEPVFANGGNACVKCYRKNRLFSAMLLVVVVFVWGSLI